LPTRLDVILVVDVESTCWDKNPPPGEASDIIEIGVTTLDFGSLKRLEKRSLMVKPARSAVSEFCTRLTTIKPEDVAAAGTLADACAVLRSDFRSKDRLWASWGNYDRKQFQENCDALGVPYPFSSDHLNAKALFSLLRGKPRQPGMAEALDVLGIPLEGTHHRGGDDAWNIAAAIAALLEPSRDRSRRTPAS
jgi:inhibitor of KinA sporulation pathway (predicted exonuclease)